MRKNLCLALTILILISCSFFKTKETKIEDGELEIKHFNNITLEMSLKPFKKNSREYIENVCNKIFTQWASLLHYTDTVSVMLWTADGSEILDYSGNLKQPLEWSKYIGNPNTKYEVNSYPNENLNLHERAFTYIDNPPKYNYGDLKNIISALKKAGETITGKPIRVGATFDPGPEFAKSEFKYKKHPEICMGATMGDKTFVCCYSTLNADNSKYAGFPEGIEQDTPFGTFFGRQSQYFLTDLGFDYLWLSNGFGFGMETWSTTGAIFDGDRFYPEKITDVRAKIVNFWELFRNECPCFRIETRGTNLSTGIDLAADGVDLRGIYNGSYNILPPPNSPWAALNGDFGLELTGYMSRITELPDNHYLFRYYIHDPWWVNSPWLDRYGREPHDIYLPMSISMINRTGETKIPTHLNILTIDNSFGGMPRQVSDEVIPHILQARRTSPDKPGPVVWVYPFDEYHNMATKQPERLEEIYYGDWFIRQAINEGFPMNTVVSTKNFVEIEKGGNTIFNESVLVTIVPPPESRLEKQLMNYVKGGGKLIIYGPVQYGSKEFLEFLNIKSTKPLSGEFSLSLSTNIDKIKNQFPLVLHHNEQMSGGGIETVVADINDPDTKILAQAIQNRNKRDIAVFLQKNIWNGGAVCYIRGTNSASFKGGHLLTPDDPEKWFSGNLMMRYCLEKFDYAISYNKKAAEFKNPINCITKCDNAYYFSGYVPNMTVEQQFKFPQGAPVITGTETELKNGFSTYRFPKAYHEECRIFIEQQEGIVSCFEIHSGEKGISRRIGINGLENATVRVYAPKSILKNEIQGFLNFGYPYKAGQIYLKKMNEESSTYYVAKDITGKLIVSW